MTGVRQIDADVCIIGSGVAGAIIASECVNAGRDVVMLEAGSRASGRARLLRIGEKVIRDYRIPRMRIWHRRARYLKTDYETIGNRTYSLSGVALVARGGSTLGWSGDAYRLRPEDFKLASVTGQGLDWPLSYDELEPYYVRGEQALRVAGDHTDEGHPPRSTPFPQPARPFHERDRPFVDLLSDHDWPLMHHNISLAPDGGAFTADELIDRLEKAPRFRLITGSVVDRILCSSKWRASGVQSRNVAADTTQTVAADTIVVCAGGIETPNLLRQSANQWWPEGLGNHSGHLGRHLISHTGIALGGRPRGYRPLNGPIGPTAATRRFDTERDQRSGKYILLWRPAPSGLLFVNAMLEQSPEDGNTVSPGAGKTRFGTPRPVIDYNDGEIQAKRTRAVEAQLESFATQMQLGVAFRRNYVHAHPMCTARMTEDDRDGVIGPDLRVHNMENVYVCGSASFTSGGAANPTLTIAALAYRLGAHLAAKSEH